MRLEPLLPLAPLPCAVQRPLLYTRFTHAASTGHWCWPRALGALFGVLATLALRAPLYFSERALAQCSGFTNIGQTQGLRGKNLAGLFTFRPE